MINYHVFIFVILNINAFLETYESAVSKLQQLKEKEYVYSTESGHGGTRSLSDKKKYKLKTIKTNRVMEKELLKIPPLNDSNDDKDNDSDDDKDNDSDGDSDDVSCRSEASTDSKCKYFYLFINY